MTDEQVEKIIKSNMMLQMNLAGIRADFEEALQRTWVGLTKEERHEISMANRPYCADIMAAHEEELKRRNNG